MFIKDPEIRECYKEDTIGRKYHAPIVSKQSVDRQEEPSEPVAVNLNKPISWKEFKKLSDDLKIYYLKHLHNTYHARICDIAKMLGISYRYCQDVVIARLNLQGFFGGRGITKKPREEWNTFIDDHNESNETVETAGLCVPVGLDEPVEPVKKEHRSTVQHLRFSQCGKLNLTELTNRISTMIAEGTNCFIDVSINEIDSIEEMGGCLCVE